MNRYKELLQDKISQKKVKVAIIGLGYVGLSLIIRLNELNFKCIGIDNDKKKVNSLKKRLPYNNYFKKEKIQELRKNCKFSLSYNILKSSDIIVICLPTPITANKDPDLTSIKNSFKNLEKNLKKGQLIILESTTYPGTTDEIFCKKLNKKYKIGNNIFVGYSPERIDPGNNINKFENTTKIVSGFSKNCKNLTEKFYEGIVDNVHSVSDLKTAEFTKLYENIFRSVNIGLVNEIKMICDKMNINVYEVIEAAKTKNFGFTPFYPGPGLGGHCIPVDPYLLSWKAKEFDIQTKFIGLSGEINDGMPYYVLNKILGALNQQNTLKNSKILIMGVAYKKNIDDIREAPALKIIKLLNEKKAKIKYYDPFIKQIKIDDNIIFKSLSRIQSFKKYDLVCLITDHDRFNYKKMLKEAKIIVDTRGKFQKKLKKIITS